MYMYVAIAQIMSRLVGAGGENWGGVWGFFSIVMPEVTMPYMLDNWYFLCKMVIHEGLYFCDKNSCHFAWFNVSTIACQQKKSANLASTNVPEHCSSVIDLPAFAVIVLEDSLVYDSHVLAWWYMSNMC